MSQGQQGELSDAGIVILLWRITESMRNRGDGDTEACILNLEKLLHLTVHSLQKKTIKASPFQFTKELVKFVRTINRWTMEEFNRDPEQVNTSLFVRAIDVLMVKPLSKYVKPERVLGELKVLTFNNLSCILKKKGKLGRALKAVSFALEIQEKLLGDGGGDQHTIITTYLNKAAILSELNRHEKAIEQISKGLKLVKEIELSLPLESSDQADKLRNEEKQNYLNYIRMVICYNMGAQLEHTGMRESAERNYRQGARLADLIENAFMQVKFRQALEKLS